MEREREDVVAALAARGYQCVRALKELCWEVCGDREGITHVLPAIIYEMDIHNTEVFIRSDDGRRCMVKILNGAIDSIEDLESVRRAHPRPIRPREPRHGYYGVAQTASGKWRGALCVTDPQTGAKHTIFSHVMANPEAAAREHDRLARVYAQLGQCGGRVHLNFAACNTR
jgi:hypothetical protein